MAFVRNKQEMDLTLVSSPDVTLCGWLGSKQWLTCELTVWQAWGCGGEEVKQAQAKQKEWEARDTERQRTRKVSLQ